MTGGCLLKFEIFGDLSNRFLMLYGFVCWHMEIMLGIFVYFIVSIAFMNLLSANNQIDNSAAKHFGAFIEFKYPLVFATC